MDCSTIGTYSELTAGVYGGTTAVECDTIRIGGVDFVPPPPPPPGDPVHTSDALCMVCTTNHPLTIEWKCARGPDEGKERRVCLDCLFETSDHTRAVMDSDQRPAKQAAPEVFLSKSEWLSLYEKKYEDLRQDPQFCEKDDKWTRLGE